MPLAKIKSDERVFIAGKTRSGKTFLAQHLLRKVKRLMVFDSKGTLVNEKNESNHWQLDEYTGQAKKDFTSGDPARVRVVIDPRREPMEVWAEAMNDVYNAGNCILYIDELYSIVDPGSRPPPIMTALWTRGAEFGISVWGTTQRPVWVPLFALSEAEHFFIFRLSLFEDRKRVAAFTSMEVLNEIRDKHGFYYHYVGEDKSSYISELETRNAQTAKTIKAGIGEANNQPRGGSSAIAKRPA